jgi:hypothetical protein
VNLALPPSPGYSFTDAPTKRAEHREPLVKTFVSFSGVKSKGTADALELFLLRVAPDVEVIRAEADIALGQDWASAIRDHLTDIDLAVICVTRDNHEKPWFLFEIGTLAQRASVIVLFLLDLSPQELGTPLAGFQAIIPTPESTWELVKGVAAVSEASPALDETRERFSSNWKEFSEALQQIRQEPGSPPGVVTIFEDANAIEVGEARVQVNQLKAHLYLKKGALVTDTGSATRSTEFGITVSSEQAFQRINAAVRQNLEQLQENFNQARMDSRQFFRLTIIFTSLGFLIMLAGVILLLLGQSTAGIVASLASVIPEATAALFFRKDAELRQTTEKYHSHILRSQQTLTMIDVCETMTDARERDRMKQQIIFRGLDIAYPDQNREPRD